MIMCDAACPLFLMYGSFLGIVLPIVVIVLRVIWAVVRNLKRRESGNHLRKFEI